MKLLLFLLAFPVFASAKMGEVLVYKFSSEGEKITWSIAEKQKTTREEAIETLHQYKKYHSHKKLIVYVKKGKSLEPWFVDELERHRIEYELIEVKKKQLPELEAELEPLLEYINRISPQKSKTLTQRVKDWWDVTYERPSQTEISHGYVMGGIKGAIAAPFWFASGLSPEIATLLTLGIAVNELLQTRYMRTLDNFYLGRKNTDPDFMTRRPTVVNIALRSAVSLMFSYVWRSISGPVGTAHSVRTLQGNAELWANMIAKLPGAWMGSVKAEKLSRTASSWVGFLVFGVGASALNHMDLSGDKRPEWFNIPPLEIGDMVIYEFSAPLIILFSAVTLSTLVIKYGPADGISRALEYFDRGAKYVSRKSVEMINFILSSIHNPSPLNYSCQLFFK